MLSESNADSQRRVVCILNVNQSQKFTRRARLKVVSQITVLRPHTVDEVIKHKEYLKTDRVLNGTNSILY